MTNRGLLSAWLSLAALPVGVGAQAPEEAWFGALSIETGVVSTSSAQSAAMFAAGAELQKPHLAGASLRIEVGGWRGDVLEAGAREARWDQSLGISLTRSFSRADGRGALKPSLASGLALHAIGHDDGSDAAEARFRRTLHPAAFMDAAVTLRLTRSELLSLEVRGRYAAIGRSPDQTSLRLALRFHPGAGSVADVPGGGSPPAPQERPTTGMVDGTAGRHQQVNWAESHAPVDPPPTIELIVPFSAFEAARQLTREKFAEVSAAARTFVRAHELGGAEIVAIASAEDVRNGSATLRAATVAGILSGAGVRTDRLRITVRSAGQNGAESSVVRVRLTH